MTETTEAIPDPFEAMPTPTNRPLGLREVALLLVGGAFASQMFDLADAAVIAGALAVVVWVAGMLRRPPLSRQTTLAIGGGLVVTFMWWPDGGWLVPAIALMWVGLAMIAFAVAMWFVQRQNSDQ